MVSCVCSGYIPHHKCCSVYVTPHQIKRFHITYHYITPKDFTHHLSRHTIPYHTTIAQLRHSTSQHSTSHYYIPHVPCHISQTFNVATHLTSDHHILHLRSHYTAVCLGTTISHHHISTEAHAVPHHTDSPHLTRVAIPYPQLFATPHPHSTSQHISHHHIPHQIPYRITPPHLTSQHIASFSTHDMISHYNRTAHCVSQFHTTTDFPHFAIWQPFHIPEHHIPHAIVHTLCISISHTMSEIATFNIAPHFIYMTLTSLRTKSLHHISAHHSTSRHAHITTFGYKLYIALSQTTPHIPHCISTIILYHRHVQ